MNDDVIQALRHWLLCTEWADGPLAQDPRIREIKARRGRIKDLLAGISS